MSLHDGDMLHLADMVEIQHSLIVLILGSGYANDWKAKAQTVG